MYFAVFKGAKRIAEGPLVETTKVAQRELDAGGTEPVLVFDLASGKVVDLDPRITFPPAPTPAPEPEPSRGPGRPRLGVVAREVTLMPRHWQWLATQPGGASVALRKLVEDARHKNRETDRLRAGRDAAYRFTTALAGNEPGFEEASRALFAGDESAFVAHSAAWPPDVREVALRLAAATWPSAAG